MGKCQEYDFSKQGGRGTIQVEVILWGCPTQRALDWRVRAAFSSVFFGSGNSVKTTFSRPSRQQVTHTVGWLTYGTENLYISINEGFVNPQSTGKSRSVLTGVWANQTYGLLHSRLCEPPRLDPSKGG